MKESMHCKMHNNLLLQLEKEEKTKMISKISAGENRSVKPMKFTGNATIVKKEFYAVKDVFRGFEESSIFVDRLASEFRRSVEDVKAL